MDPVTPTTPPANPEVPDPKRNSLDSNTIIVIFLLLFFYPVGVILMWLLMKHWQTWVKVLITLLFILPIVIGVLLALFLTALDPKSALEESRQAQTEMSETTSAPIDTTN
jgi:hypothetical protein